MIDTIIAAIISGGVAGSLVIFIAKSWLEARLKASIEHEYQKQLAMFERDLDRGEKIDLVADLLAEWLRIPKCEPIPRDQRTLLNKLSFRASLWLPADLAIELSKPLQNASDAKSPFDLLLLARKSLIRDSSLETKHLTFWKPELEERGDVVIKGPSQ